MAKTQIQIAAGSDNITPFLHNWTCIHPNDVAREGVVRLRASTEAHQGTGTHQPGARLATTVVIPLDEAGILSLRAAVEEAYRVLRSTKGAGLH